MKKPTLPEYLMLTTIWFNVGSLTYSSSIQVLSSLFVYCLPLERGQNLDLSSVSPKANIA